METFGKYALYDKLAEGGMAVVWRAKLHGPGGFEKSLVLKQIRPELAANLHFIDLFVAEAKTTVSLTHANIVPVFELGMVDGTYFLALEYIDGPPLREIIAQGPVSPFLAGYIVEQVLRGLDYAHRRGVVHRDSSSANVMVSREGEVKIVDFGIAAPQDERAVRGGSRGYTAPEQEAGGRADARSDLYAVGVLLWEMIQGKRFDGATPSSMPLGKVVQKATAPDPESRYQDAATMLKDVSRFLRDVSYAPNQMELSSLVRKRCPDVPQGEHRAESDDLDRPDGPRTAAVPGRKRTQTGQQVTFATRIAVAPEPPAASGRRGVLLVAGGAVLLLGLASAGAVVVWQGRVPPPTDPPPGPPVAVAPTPRATKMGKLSVKSEPPAEVRLGDKLLGTSPLEADVPLDGPLEISLKRRGYATVERTLPPAEAMTVSEKLQALPKGRLTLNALPWAHVTIDGEKAPDTPISKMPISAGQHIIKLTCPPTKREYKLPVLVNPDEDLRRVVDLRGGEPRVTD